jgi:NADPH:quinone reductase
MLTVQAVRFGGPEVLAARPAPDPVAGPGQAVVRAAAADVLFVDTAIRAGRTTDFFPIRPPYVPGNGIAGRVISAGDGVDPGWLGRAVVVHTGGPGSGGYAEQAAVGAEELIPVPGAPCRPRSPRPLVAAPESDSRHPANLISLNLSV